MTAATKTTADLRQAIVPHEDSPAACIPADEIRDYEESSRGCCRQLRTGSSIALMVKKYTLTCTIISFNALLIVLITFFGGVPWYIVFVSLATVYKILLICFIIVHHIWHRISSCCKEGRRNPAAASLSQEHAGTADDSMDGVGASGHYVREPSTRSGNPVGIRGVNPRDSVIMFEDKQQPITMGFLIPCFAEGRDEITRSIDSLIESIAFARRTIPNIRPVFFLVVDGLATGMGNDMPTYKIIETLYNQAHTGRMTYDSWKEKAVEVATFVKTVGDSLVFSFSKQENLGKKDSLIVIRELVKNARIGVRDREIDQWFQTNLQQFLAVGPDSPAVIDYLVGIDADTRFDKVAVIELLQIAKDENEIGISGYLVPDRSVGKLWHPLFLFQYFEYLGQQGLTRYGQSLLGKVTCLPGCIQNWRMDERTLGKPLDIFKRSPRKNSLREQIQALLGEDRRYTGLVLYEHPNAKTRVSLKAKAFTRVPDSWSVFLSQRRRWMLSCQVNNLSDFASSNLPWMIRFIAITQVWNSFFAIVTLYCAARWIAVAATAPTLLILIPLGLFFAIYVYKMVLIVLFAQDIADAAYMFVSMIVYSILSAPVNIVITFRALLTMDDFRWGLTQQTSRDNSVNVPSTPTEGGGNNVF